MRKYGTYTGDTEVAFSLWLSLPSPYGCFFHNLGEKHSHGNSAVYDIWHLVLLTHNTTLIIQIAVWYEYTFFVSTPCF